MKEIRKYITLLLLAAAGYTARSQVVVSYQVFYDELSPYGHWVDYPGYGYAWVPDAGPSFIPYSTGGYWTYTEYGWTWVSDYSWGWAPFHYGRWQYDIFYGWIWIPGDVWGPAWVVWRHCPGYYGWAPMTPGMTIIIATSGNYNIPPGSWCFVDEHHLGDRDAGHYYGPRKNNEQLLSSSTPVTHVYEERGKSYVAGPARNEVEKVRGSAISPMRLTDRDKPGISTDGEKLAVYRPMLNASGNARPAKVETKDQVKSVQERSDKAAPAEKRQPEQKREVPPPPREVQKTEPVVPDNTRVKPPKPTPPPVRSQPPAPKPAPQPRMPRPAPQPPRPAPAPRPVKPPGNRTGPR